MSVVSEDSAASSLISAVRTVESVGGCGASSCASTASPTEAVLVRSAAMTTTQKRVGSSSCSSKESQATWPGLWLAHVASSVVLPKPAEAESKVKGSERPWLRRSIKCGSRMIEHPFSSAVWQTPGVFCAKDSFLWLSLEESSLSHQTEQPVEKA